MKTALYKQKNGYGGNTKLLKEVWNHALALRGNFWPADCVSHVPQQEE